MTSRPAADGPRLRAVVWCERHDFLRPAFVAVGFVGAGARDWRLAVGAGAHVVQRWFLDAAAHRDFGAADGHFVQGILPGAGGL
jgi:hypothetical protein